MADDFEGVKGIPGTFGEVVRVGERSVERPLSSRLNGDVKRKIRKGEKKEKSKEEKKGKHIDVKA